MSIFFLLRFDSFLFPECDILFFSWIMFKISNSLMHHNAAYAVIILEVIKKSFSY